MHFLVQTELSYITTQSCDVLLQVEVANEPTQSCKDAKLTFADDAMQRVLLGEDGIGTRRWVRSGTAFECHYTAAVCVTRARVALEVLLATPLPQTPGEVTKYLMPSRYCHPEAFFDIVPAQFGSLLGGALVAAMSRWIMENFTYDNGASHAGTTATDSFAKRAGVCRDYAHVLITMLRAAGIPARFVSCYAPDVTPQDFHAVAEVYLDGAWHLVDPTGMAQADEIIRIGVGRDAADVSFMTSYGWMELKNQTVDVQRIT